MKVFLASVQFSPLVMSDSATPGTAARQVSLSITNSQSLLTLMSIKLVMPSNHLILCCPLLLPPSIFPSIRVFSKESVLHIRWPMYWSFSMSSSNEYSGLISLRDGLGLSYVHFNTVLALKQASVNFFLKVPDDKGFKLCWPRSKVRI